MAGTLARADLMPKEIIKSRARMLERAAPILSRLPTGKPVIIEVGVSAGFMSEHLLRTRSDLVLHAIDNWLPADQQPKQYADTGDIHATLSQAQQDSLRQMAEGRLAPYAARALIHHQGSIEAARDFALASVDVVFLDARHDHNGVLADCNAWWPVVKPGGWLGGHDLGNPDPRFRFGVDEAVRDFAIALSRSFSAEAGLTWWIRK